MSIKDKLISNTSYIFLNWFFITLLSLSFWIVIGKTLSKESFGIAATALEISTLLSTLIVFGLDQSINKLIPEFLKRKQKNKIQGLINFSLKLISISSLVTVLVLIFFSSQIYTLLNLRTPEVIWLIGIAIIIMALSTFFGSICYGYQKMKKIFFVNLYGHVTKIVVASILIMIGFDFFGPIIGFILCFLITLITLIERRFFKISKKPDVDKNLILKFSIPASMVIILNLLFNNTQLIILSSLQMIEVTGLFAIALKISTVIPIIPGILKQALFPIISGLSIDDSTKKMRSYLIKLAFRYSLFITLPVVVFLLLFSKYVILFFSTEEYLDAVYFLPFLAIAGLFLGLGGLFKSSLYAIGKPKKYRNNQLIVTLVFLFSVLPLTLYFSGMGLTLSYLVSTFLFFFLNFIVLKKYLPIDLPWKDMGRILISIFISFSFLIFLKPIIKNFFMAGMFVILSSIIYLTILLKLNFYLKEDLKVLDFMSKRSPILKKQINKIRNFLSKHAKRSYKEV